MKTKDFNNYDIWDCDNEHEWLSYPGPHKDTWHLEQLHESQTGTYMKRDPKSAWLVAGIDPSVCPLCALRMKVKARQQGRPTRRKSAPHSQKHSKITA